MKITMNYDWETRSYTVTDNETGQVVRGEYSIGDGVWGWRIDGIVGFKDSLEESLGRAVQEITATRSMAVAMIATGGFAWRHESVHGD